MDQIAIIIHLVDFQDGIILKREVISKEYGNLDVNATYLQNIVIRDCDGNQEQCTNTFGVTLSDLSVWNTLIPSKVLIDWTTCR